MGRRRKRLIVQADLTSEEDQAFLAWVEEKRRRRRLAEEIREGLRLQYERGTGPVSALPPVNPRAVNMTHHERAGALDQGQEATGTASKLQKLVQSF